MRWLLVLLMAFASVAAQVNLKATSSRLPVSLAQAAELGFGRAALLVLRAGSLSGITLVITWYAYRHFGFLELWVASALTYIVAVVASYYVFDEVLTWPRIGGIGLVAAGVGLFFVK